MATESFWCRKGKWIERWDLSDGCQPDRGSVQARKIGEKGGFVKAAAIDRSSGVAVATGKESQKGVRHHCNSCGCAEVQGGQAVGGSARKGFARPAGERKANEGRQRIAVGLGA